MSITRLFLSIIVTLSVLTFFSCEKESKNDTGESIIPSKFKVDIPNSLSKADLKSTMSIDQDGDTLLGNEIYQHLNFFIAIGENSAELIEAIFVGIKYHNIESVSDLNYVSDDDKREKHLIVKKDISFEGTTWEYMLLVTDYLSESDEDGGIAMQVFWNNSPIEGIAILKPSRMNFADDDKLENAIFRIEYSATGDNTYDETMEVQISDLPMPTAGAEPWALKTMKMFVGKKGDIVDVFGNSNHPNAQFNPHDSSAKGFNWAFVASGNEVGDIGVAEVGLPLSSLNINTRQAILIDNSIFNVFKTEIGNYLENEYPQANPNEIAEMLNDYLKNAKAPGYFDKNGFIQSEVAPGSSYSDLETRIKALIPFVPAQVSNLTIEFKR